MKLTRREALAAAVGGAAALKSGAQTMGPQYAPGPFKATLESLHGYQVPEWFRDAKFGIWAHWGPQSAVEAGDWYARNMYMPGSRQYEYHLKTYGHPSKVGFKDLIPAWKAERFDPAHLISLYKKAGAKYFVSMGVHHDNFDLWDSRHNRWNAVNMGPRRDVVGEWARAARAAGLKFGVSEHLAVSYHWFQTSHGADKSGPLAGVPYDGANPNYFDYYHETHETPQDPWDPAHVPLRWKQHYFDRVTDLLDRYEPDLLYTDGPLFFDAWGLGLAAHLYNRSAARHGGRAETVYANKDRHNCAQGVCLLDLERGVVDKVWDDPWQTDTCIGNWHYDRYASYKSPKLVIDMLVDIVSRNGNLLLNFPLPSSGALDYEELVILDAITKWMAVNSEAIYGTRPWKTFGSGPATDKAAAAKEAGSFHGAESFNENKRKLLTGADVRYTKKGSTLYAFSMGCNGGSARFAELAQGATKVERVTLLGHKGDVTWRQTSDALVIDLPNEAPCEHAVAFRVDGV